MVLRITQNKGADSGAILFLEGHVVADSAVLLEMECSELLRLRDEVSVDLEGVDYVDRTGIEVLTRLSRAGAAILCPVGPVASVLEGAGIPVVLEPREMRDDH